jgi:prepilin-type N-terminal cleavage/methylation domain-containing protein/prepilin-type processing-associated H-X9-DG protein
MKHNVSSRRRCVRGFTLIELLIVIAVVALIASFLIPSITKAKDQAASAACANNLHQIGAAFLMYAQDNENKFPFHADWGPANKEDWIHWQPGPGRDPNDLTKTSAIAKYLGKFTGKVFHCPSDDVSSRTRFDTSGQGPRRYEFSYSFSSYLASNGSAPPGHVPGPRLTAIVNPSGKIMVVEEDELSLDDGHYWPAGNKSNLENYLGSRHSRPRLRNYKDWIGMDLAKRPDRNERGNVVFADGHVDFVTRAFTWSDTSYDPWK